MELIEKTKGWVTEERGMWIAGVLLAAAIGFGLGNGHTTGNSINFLSDQLFWAKHPPPQVVEQAPNKEAP